MVLGLMLVVGCHDQLPVPAPKTEGQRSYLLAFYSEGQPAEVWGIDVEGESVGGPTLSLNKSSSMVSIHFTCPLSAMGLPRGPIELLPEEKARIQLPDALALQALSIEDGRASTWTAIDELPSPVATALRRLPTEVTEPSMCDERASTLDIQGRGGPDLRGRSNFVLPLRSGDFLVGTALDRAYRVDRTGRMSLVDLAPDGPWLAAYEDPNQKIWLVAADGRTASGTIDGQWIVETSTVPFKAFQLEGAATDIPITSAALVGPDTNDVPFELFAAGEGRTLARFNVATSTWTEIRVDEKRDRPLGRFSWAGGPRLLWLGERQVLASGVTDDDHELIYVDGDEITREQLPGSAGRPLTLVPQPDGLMVGTLAGRLLQETPDGNWVQLATNNFQYARPIVRDEEVLLVGRIFRLPLLDDLGAFRWLQLIDGELCPVGPAFAPVAYEAHQIAPSEWLIFTLNGSADDEDFGVARLTIGPPGPGGPCSGGTIDL